MRHIAITLLCWLLIAIIVGGRGWLESLPAAGPPILVLVLTAMVLVLCRNWSALRSRVLTINIRWMLTFHLIRFVGIYFLFLHEEGVLPYDFAVYGGWGDIIAASSALLLLFIPKGKSFLLLLAVWNLLGLADLVFVVFTAAKLNIMAPGSIRALLHLPLSLLPTFVVPLLISSHLIILERLLLSRNDPAELEKGTYRSRVPELA